MSAVESLGKYVIRRQLGRGAMGTVYEGFDPVIERIVAIKTVRLPDDDDDETAEEIARFRREAQAAGRLTHANIVGVYDYGETADMAYIVMEYVDGPPLKTLLDRNERFTLPGIVRIMEDLLAGLQFSHDRGVVHRDIKPANLMLTQAGQAKIADFGIARIERSSLTQAGTVLGTPAYMSPEQFMGQIVDLRTDIYSSGVLLYQLLTGERPFEGSMSAIMHKALNTEPPLPSQISVTAPRAFDAVVRRAMAKRPAERFPSAAAFLDAIRAAFAAPEEESDDVDLGVNDSTMVSKPAAIPGAAALLPPPVAAAIPIPPPVARPLPAAIRVADPKAAATAVPVAGAAAAKSPVPAVAAVVAGLAVAGGIGYFLLAGGSAPPLDAPKTVAAAGSVPPRTPAGTVVTTPVTPPVTPPVSSIGPPPTVAPAVTAVPDASPPAAAPPVPAAAPPPKLLEPRREDAAAPAAVGTPGIPAVPAAGPQIAMAPPLAPAAPAHDPLEAVRGELGSYVSHLSCSMLDGDVRDGVVQMNGLGGKPAIDGIRQKLASMGLVRPAPWLRVAQLDPAFCVWADLLRPIAATFGEPGSRLSLRLAGDPSWLQKDDYIRPHLTMAGFRGELHVDYLDRQGNVQHLYPQLGDPREHTAADPPRLFGPGETVNLGEPGPNNRGWQVDEPYGTDMIVAIASEDALFDRPRTANVEKAAAYLKDLRKALDQARARGVQLTAVALPVETRRK